MKAAPEIYIKQQDPSIGKIASEEEKILSDIRFSGLYKFEPRLWLSSPTMHGDEQQWVDEAIQTNWVSTVGRNIREVEAMMARFIGREHAVGLSAGTAALHLAVKVCGERLYGRPKPGHGALEGKKVFCCDLTFDATVNPVAYEGGEAVFIDTERDTWNICPEALEKAFEIYPDVKLIIYAHLYGTPGKVDEIQAVAQKHGALVIEDAAESLGATYLKDGVWTQTGCFGDESVISFNGNKIITGSAGGMFVTDSEEAAKKVVKWSTQSREQAPWYQHEELGYNYRMSNIIAGVIRGQIPYINDHLEQKKNIYERYKAGFADLPVSMNPWDEKKSRPNFWLSCILIDEDAMCGTERGDTEAFYSTEPGKSCPTEILEVISAFNAEGRPIWKPMHMQPIYRDHDFITREGSARSGYGNIHDVGADIFRRGLCLPSDNKMTPEQQDIVIDIVHRCFR